MSARRTGIDDYRSVLDPGRQRRRLLTRAALAAGVMVVMLAGLLIFGDDDNPGVETAVDATPADTQKAGALPTFQTVPLVAPEARVETASVADTSPEVEVAPDQHAAMPEPELEALPLESREPDLPPTEGVNVTPAEGLEVVPAGVSAKAPAHAVKQPSPSLAMRSNEVRQRPPAPGAPPAAAGISADGFSAHLGEYAALDGAERLREALAGQGMPATLVRRVVLGPVSTRKAAEQIVARLQRESKVAGFIVSDPGGKGFLVQAGVFAERGNAEAQQKRLSTSARKAKIQARVVLGPYASRDEAEAALEKVRSERRIAGTIVAAAR